MMRFRGKISAGGACLALFARVARVCRRPNRKRQFTTDYVLRGIKSNRKPPGGAGRPRFDTGVGLTVGTWVSSLDFGDDTNLEWDLYAATISCWVR